MAAVSALLAGLLFGLGLMLSGMGQPTKVQNFLDFFGQWDPSLALVMVGAIAVAWWPFRLAKRTSHPPMGAVAFELPTNKKIDARLLSGAALFGIGWGLAGYCPGPALVSLSALITTAWWFVPAMLVGMWISDKAFGK
ncbi:MAG: DUF6691 family protein [Paenalcaligenes sp.]